MASQFKEIGKDAGTWDALVGLGSAIGEQAGMTGAVGSSLSAGFAGLDILLTAIEKKKPSANRLFKDNGHDDAPSPQTLRYFKHRKIKKITGTLVSFAGSVASSYTAVNTTGIARHGRSVANTIEHLMRFQAEAAKIPRSQFIQDLVAVMIKCKTIKLAARTGSLTADCIPGCAIASAAISGITGIAANAAMNKMDEGGDNGLVTIVSCALHWRAFQEMQLVGVTGGKGSGPAMRLVDRLYHGVISENRWFGVQPEAFVREPAGWMVIHDKLTLI